MQKKFIEVKEEMSLGDNPFISFIWAERPY